MIKCNYHPEGGLIDTPENIAACSSVAALTEAMESGRVLEAVTLMCDYDHNLVLNIAGIRGIIPRTEGAVGIAEGNVRDIALISRVGKPVCFIVERIDCTGDEPVAYLSRRAAQERCQRDYIDRLLPGDIVEAKVTHLENFGAFCDIGCGIAALLPIDAISVSRIAHPSDRLRCGDRIFAVVKSVDPFGRVSLTHRELLGTWQQNAEKFAQGETVSGTVRTVEDYGIFVELSPNLAGLAEPKAGVKPGQRASVYIKSLLPGKMKGKLIIIDSFDSTAEEPPIKYFISEGHIDSWRYSPDCCSKTIETVF